MRLIVVISLLSCIFAAPDYSGSGTGENFRKPGTTRKSLSTGPNGLTENEFARGNSGKHRSGKVGGRKVKCGPGEARDRTGACVEATFTHNTFFFSALPIPVVQGPPPVIPSPRIDYNVIFVRTPERSENLDPIIVPPAEKRTIVYVLTKNGQAGQQIIEVPAAPGLQPEVFYVNYNDGDNPTLAGGVTLQEVLSEDGLQGQVVGGENSGLERVQGGDSGLAFRGTSGGSAGNGAASFRGASGGIQAGDSNAGFSGMGGYAGNAPQNGAVGFKPVAGGIGGMPGKYERNSINTESERSVQSNSGVEYKGMTGGIGGVQMKYKANFIEAGIGGNSQRSNRLGSRELPSGNLGVPGKYEENSMNTGFVGNAQINSGTEFRGLTGRTGGIQMKYHGNSIETGIGGNSQGSNGLGSRELSSVNVGVPGKYEGRAMNTGFVGNVQINSGTGFRGLPGRTGGIQMKYQGNSIVAKLGENNNGANYGGNTANLGINVRRNPGEEIYFKPSSYN